MKLKRFFAYLANKFYWVPWSNFRYRNEERHSKNLLSQHNVSSLDDIQNLARIVYRNFEYTKDGPDLLWDAVCPPPYAYKQLLSGKPFRDDCDGFHSLMYHCLSQNGITCYLMVVSAVGCGHCVLTFYYNNAWHVLDYTTIYYSSPADPLAYVVGEYNAAYVKRYSKVRSEVFFNGFLSYNYEKGKFSMVTPHDPVPHKDPAERSASENNDN